jgi:molybdopterin-containing oxidoreductase family iron-sulfur binding subunit
VDEYARDPGAIAKRRRRPGGARLYHPFRYDKGHKWGMTIDLARCNGCAACAVACQAENNIPAVGRDQCAKGRGMHWIRIDQYREGTGDEVLVHHQPMPCQQCDNAPCENVCPVNATNHSPEGLNDMVYNRCIGTRYCSNNCPYKVRRFNYFNFQKRALRDPVQKLLFNPDVTVRQVGVMEKCTFCVQRINASKFAAANAGRRLRDGEVEPACAQACPARAITFGDLNLVEDGRPSRVASLRRSRRAFLVLEELLTEPAVSYLARLRNPGGG